VTARHAAALALVLLAGCGGTSGDRPTLRVSAASSLRLAFSQYGRQFRGARVSFSFAGSDQLAAQIREGIHPDVFASANETLPAQLHAAGALDQPVVFAVNRLVIAVPAGSRRVRSLADLAKPGVTIAAGSASVPVGSYTRKVLAGLAPAQRAAILAHVRSEEPDVAGIVGKLTQGAVDAGFVYVTDVQGARGRLQAIELPAKLRPRVAYAAGVVRGAAHPALARAFIQGLLAGAGGQALRRAGFAPPPR
jgi:molybdate transport system substrate-binding protein